MLMSYPGYDNKRVAPTQTHDSIAKIRLVKEQKSINLGKGKYVPQGIIKRAFLSMPFWFMIISLAIWSFSIIGFFVFILLKYA
jgi:hypothetical protein